MLVLPILIIEYTNWKAKVLLIFIINKISINDYYSGI